MGRRRTHGIFDRLGGSSSVLEGRIRGRSNGEVQMKTLCAIAVVSSAVLLGAQGRQQLMIEWAYVGSEQSQTKYSAAADITPSNVSQLEFAWQWRPNELPQSDKTQPGNFQATPLMI